MAKKRKPKNVLSKAFSKALKKRKFGYAQKIKRFEDAAVMNDMSQMALKALDEIRDVQTFMGLPQRSTTKLDHVPGNGEWSDGQVDVYHRFMAWFNASEKKQRDSVILYVEGYGLREIDKMVRMRNGSAKLKIKQGVLMYCYEAGWIKPTKPRPEKKERRGFIKNPTRIIIWEDDKAVDIV